MSNLYRRSREWCLEHFFGLGPLAWTRRSRLRSEDHFFEVHISQGGG